MTEKGWTSKKVWTPFGWKWIYVRSKRQIPYEQSLKRMKLRKGGALKEQYIDEALELLKKAERKEITLEDLKILDKILRKKKRKKKMKKF